MHYSPRKRRQPKSCGFGGELSFFHAKSLDLRCSRTYLSTTETKENKQAVPSFAFALVLVPTAGLCSRCLAKSCTTKNMEYMNKFPRSQKKKEEEKKRDELPHRENVARPSKRRGTSQTRPAPFLCSHGLRIFFSIGISISGAVAGAVTVTERRVHCGGSGSGVETVGQSRYIIANAFDSPLMCIAI